MSQNDSYFNRLQQIKLGLAPKEAVAKPKKPIPKKSPKKKEQEKKEREERGGDETNLQKWYRDKMKRMGDRCYWCGCKVENKVYQYAVYSICHILDKRETVCPSLATHPLNWIPLCPDHHTMFDKMNWEEREELPFWETVRERLIMMYPDAPPQEKRFFPYKLREEIENEF